MEHGEPPGRTSPEHKPVRLTVEISLIEADQGKNRSVYETYFARVVHASSIKNAVRNGESMQQSIAAVQSTTFNRINGHVAHFGHLLIKPEHVAEVREQLTKNLLEMAARYSNTIPEVKIIEG